MFIKLTKKNENLIKDIYGTKLTAEKMVNNMIHNTFCLDDIYEKLHIIKEFEKNLKSFKENFASWKKS